MKCPKCGRDMDFDVVGAMDMQSFWTIDNCIRCHITIEGEKILSKDLPEFTLEADID